MRDKLTAHMKTVDDEYPTEEQIEMTTDELTGQIDAATGPFEPLKKVEKAWPSGQDAG